VEIVTLRVTATGRLPRVKEEQTPLPAGGRGRLRRRVFLDGAWCEIDIVHRAELREPLAGPALVEEEYTTMFVADGWTCGPEEGGDLVARRSGQARRNPDEA
jgi:N-methylhydantoinase A